MLLDLIEQRHSVRKYLDKEVSTEIIDKILEAGRLAPSWINVQPWHFIVIRDNEKKELLSRLSNGQAHVAQAPVIIACCLDLESWEHDKFRKILEKRAGTTEDTIRYILGSSLLNPSLQSSEMVLLRSIEQITYAIGYMTLETASLGLGCCVVGALGNELTQVNQEILSVVKHELNMPDSMVINSILTIGYEDETTKIPAKLRKPREEVISFERIGNKS